MVAGGEDVEPAVAVEIRDHQAVGTVDRQHRRIILPVARRTAPEDVEIGVERLLLGVRTVTPDHQIEIAVAVEIGGPGAAGALDRQQRRIGAGETLRSTPENQRMGGQNLRDKEIEIAVAVEIGGVDEPGFSPVFGVVILTASLDAAGGGDIAPTFGIEVDDDGIGIEPIRAVAENPQFRSRVAAERNVEISGMKEISDRAAVGPIGTQCHPAVDVESSAVAVVVDKRSRIKFGCALGAVGDQNIGEAVVIEVGADHLHRGMAGKFNPVRRVEPLRTVEVDINRHIAVAAAAHVVDEYHRRKFVHADADRFNRDRVVGDKGVRRRILERHPRRRTHQMAGIVTQRLGIVVV